jgi:hypothetical protein
LLEVAGVDQVVEVGGVFEEAFDVGGVLADLAGLGGHDGGIGVEIDHLAVFEKVPPVRAQRADRDVVAHFAAGAFEQALEEVGQGEDGGAEVEGVSGLLEHVEFAADLGVFLVDGDVVSLLGERDGGGDSAEAGADDDDFFRVHVGGQCALSLASSCLAMWSAGCAARALRK